MGRSKIRPNQLTKEVNKILTQYTDKVVIETKEAVEEISVEALKLVKEHAPKDKRKKVKRKGTYKRSLKQKTVYENSSEKRNAIYASGNEYRLTHLLENGHASPNGGRAKAIPHFKYGEDYITKELPRRIKKKIGGI